MSKSKPLFAGASYVWLMLICVLFSSCTPHLSLYKTIDQLAQKRQYSKAATLIEKNKGKYGNRNALLWHMDLGLMQHYNGQFKRSNANFAEADRIWDELFQVSLTRQISSFAVNDTILPFRGDDAYVVMIHLYKALNYIQLGNVPAAMVEARKVDEKLNYINSKYKSDKKNVYQEDAFARLLSGILFEMGGTRADWNDAHIANNKAIQLYQGSFIKKFQVGLPQLLQENWMASSQWMGGDIWLRAKKKQPTLNFIALPQRSQMGQIYFVHFAGRAPQKYEIYVDWSISHNKVSPMALPAYRRVPYVINGTQVTLQQTKQAIPLQLVHPLGEIVIDNFKSEYGRILARTIARTIAKSQLYNSRQAGLLGQVFNIVSEQADLRAWQTLPDRILMGRAFVPPGSYPMQVEYLTKKGNVAFSSALTSVDIRASETRFVFLHSYQ